VAFNMAGLWDLYDLKGVFEQAVLSIIVDPSGDISGDIDRSPISGTVDPPDTFVFKGSKPSELLFNMTFSGIFIQIKGESHLYGAWEGDRVSVRSEGDHLRITDWTRENGVWIATLHLR
jgi:hypothetical protein